MEYLRGLPVDMHCDRHGLGITERLKLFRRICDAVQYAHSKLILHRDIKPSNILVDEQGTPKLIDFGIAKPLGVGAAHVQQTIDQHRYFSLANAAPEQVRGDPASGHVRRLPIGNIAARARLRQSAVRRSPAVRCPNSNARSRPRFPNWPSRMAESATDSIVRARRTGSARALAVRLRGDIDGIVQRAVRKEPGAALSRRSNSFRRTSNTTWRIGRSWAGAAIAAIASRDS